jgi:hypothetical protein
LISNYFRIPSSPRRAFRAIQTEIQFHNILGELDQAITRITDIPGTIGGIKRDRVPHRVFQLVPENEDRIFVNALVLPVTDYVLEKLMTVEARRSADRIFETYQALSPIPAAAEWRGRMWERALHVFLASRPINSSLPLRALDNPSSLITPTITISSKINSHMFTFDNELHSLLVDQMAKQSTCYLYPTIRTFPTVDSILYQPDQALWLFQATIASTHHIKISGLARIQRVLQPQTTLKPLRPSKAKPWNLVFVVPKETGASYKKSQPMIKVTVPEDVTTGVVEENAEHWSSRLCQYMLELDSSKVFSSWKEL